MDKFETHLTIDESVSEIVLSEIETWSNDRGYKWTHIILDQGDHPSQPMITLWGSDALELLDLSKKVAKDIELIGGKVIRTKIEMDLKHCKNPGNFFGEFILSPKYIEHHVKLRLSEKCDCEELSNLASLYNGRLSRNARRRLEDGRVERFVTQRFYPQNHSSAKNELQELKVDLQKKGFEILEVEEELVVFDSQLQLDNGWLPKQGEIFLDEQTKSIFVSGLLEEELRNRSLNRPVIFDPALYPNNAYRAGEPQFKFDENQKIWQSCRETVIHHILTTIANSGLSRHLVLRGSVLLKTWLGENARNPGDLDFVVFPSDIGMYHDQGIEIIQLIEDLLRNLQINEMITIPDQPFASAEIWTYDKAPGTRLIVPWVNHNSAFDGTVQLDLVFGEKMPSAPKNVDVQIGMHPKVSFLAASPEQSLAWKILWIANDHYVQGKDLYDAVLLAESFPISFLLLEDTFLLDPDADFQWFKKDFLEDMNDDMTEWDDYKKEYPNIKGTGLEWQKRLVTALRPVFEEMGEL